MSGLWSPSSLGAVGGIRPPGPAVGRAGGRGDKERKKELFRKALEKKKKEEKDRGKKGEGAAASAEGSSPGTKGEKKEAHPGKGGLPGGHGHMVDVLA